MPEFETLGYHTYEDRKPGDEKIGPVWSQNVHSFLGRGYYFWEDDYSYAMLWGTRQYYSKGYHFFIGKAKIGCAFDAFFDLVGVKRHQTFIQEVNSEFSKRRPGKPFLLSTVIEILKRASRDTDDRIYYGKFNYKVIRALDRNPIKDTKGMSVEKIIRFSEKAGGIMVMNPCYIICLLEKKDILLEPLLIVHSSRAGRSY